MTTHVVVSDEEYYTKWYIKLRINPSNFSDIQLLHDKKYNYDLIIYFFLCHTTNHSHILFKFFLNLCDLICINLTTNAGNHICDTCKT